MAAASMEWRSVL